MSTSLRRLWSCKFGVYIWSFFNLYACSIQISEWCQLFAAWNLFHLQSNCCSEIWSVQTVFRLFGELVQLVYGFYYPIDKALLLMVLLKLVWSSCIWVNFCDELCFASLVSEIRTGYLFHFGAVFNPKISTLTHFFNVFCMMRKYPPFSLSLHDYKGRRQ